MHDEKVGLNYDPMREASDLGDDRTGVNGSLAKVTIVIATKDRSTELARTLGILRAAPERPPITVVDNGSVDDTVERAGEVPGVKVVALGRNLGAAARNVGVALAHTRYVAFCDDDSWWDPGMLDKACALLDSHNRLALVAPTIYVNGNQLDPTCTLMACSPLGSPPWEEGSSQHRAIMGFLACAAVVRRQAFLEVGGFAEWLHIGGEEKLHALDLAAAGWHLLYAPELIAHHHPSSVRDAQRRRRLLARNDVWIDCLRRPAGVAVRHMWRTASAGRHDQAVLLGLVDAVAGFPRLLRHRAVVPPQLEATLQVLWN